MGSFKAACIQVNAQNDMQANIAAALGFAGQARKAGADLILMPENVSMMEWGRHNVIAQARPEAEHPALAAFQDFAAKTGAWLNVGSLHVLIGEDRVANRGYVIDGKGGIASRYDKIHMFDVDLGNGEVYRESATFNPGDQSVIADLPWGKLGLSICYDVRFPSLYRALAKAGASFLTVPAAFTRKTGTAHWHVLLRARAIETGTYVFAPAQTGEHPGSRQTFGHALIVSPWGEVLADAGTDPGFVLAEIDPEQVAEVRRQVPSLSHDRAFAPAS